MRTKLAVTMVVVGLLCIPGLSSAKGGGFVGMIQKPFQKAAAKVQALRQSWKEQRIVNQNIRALRRASPELNAAYKTAHRTSRKQNSSLLAWSAGMAMLGTANAMWASGHYAAGDPVFGTVAAAGSAIIVARTRASWLPVAQSSSASSWSCLIVLASLPSSA